MNKAFELWNLSIEDMGEDIANGRRDHVYLLPGDTNYPTPIAAHPRARAAPRAGEPGSSVPEGQAPPTAPPTVGRATPAFPPHDFTEHVPRTTPAPSSKPTTTSEAAASSSDRPRPMVGSTTAAPSTSEPEAPPPEDGWPLAPEIDRILCSYNSQLQSPFREDVRYQVIAMQDWRVREGD